VFSTIILGLTPTSFALNRELLDLKRERAAAKSSFAILMQNWRPWETAPDADSDTAVEREPLICILAEEERLTKEQLREAMLALRVRRGLLYKLCCAGNGSDLRSRLRIRLATAVTRHLIRRVFGSRFNTNLVSVVHVLSHMTSFGTQNSRFKPCATVAMVETSHLRELNNLSHSWRLNGPRILGVFAQR
jgi:hypothetical protein